MVAASLPPGSHRQYHPYHLGLSHGALFLPPLPPVPLSWCPPPPPPFLPLGSHWQCHTYLPLEPLTFYPHLFATLVSSTVPHLSLVVKVGLSPGTPLSFCHLGHIPSCTLATHITSAWPPYLLGLSPGSPPLPLYHLGHITSCTLAIRVILTVPPLPLGPLTWCPCHMDHINGITLTTQPVPPPFLPPGSHPQLLPDLHYYTLLTSQVKSPVIAWWVKLLAPLCILTHITIARLASLVIPLMLTLPCKSHLLGYSLPPSPLSYFPLPILR